MSADELPTLGRGFYWQELKLGQRFQTFRRTITEADIINFINTTGMLETIFTDTTFRGGAIKGRPVPGGLTYGLIEGILMQSMVQGTGLALLEVHKKIVGPVVAGDTIGAEVEVVGIRRTAKSGRAVVTSAVSVNNQRGAEVMRYIAVRLLAGKPDSRQ
ncbi:acyl dehydratase [Bordetella genomosp. 9]|uniref:Acyl dehydratase n=1 Tax=Bordetella genomosp. 9 TaxID=1416803 RepID=A0A261R6J6_9BORD|nr:MaoC family dehydratase [Bordetella genomosp. 9]OZI20668.1 acyl dehydratase [Bordetella genomosp. 9]